MKIALVYDRVNKYGGAERILEALHDIWPDAPLYTSVYNGQTAPWAKSFSVTASILQSVPYAMNNHEFFAWATPFAFEQFTFDGYDIVISITSAEAKNIITKPGTFHVCYCLTPTRYLWSGYDEYVTRPGVGMMSSLTRLLFKKIAPVLKKWDSIAGARPDMYLAISGYVKNRIERYYGRKADKVIYPPVDTETFHMAQCSGLCPVIDKRVASLKDGYYLTVSRFVGYKRIDIIIRAFNELNLPLVVIGRGREASYLKKIARPNVIFIDQDLTDEDLVHYYSHCRSFVFAGQEDFGLVVAEAQSCGAPVIAFRDSGCAEIVKEGETGYLFDSQNPRSLIDSVRMLEHAYPDRHACRKNAERFSVQSFKKLFKACIRESYPQYMKSL